MRIERLGTGTPEIAVVGAIHGDEPCGARAIERFLATNPDVDRPVKLIIANEQALDHGVRFLEADLNRAFTDDAPDTHERRLAQELATELEDMTVLAIHSTQSHPEPFALTTIEGNPASQLAQYLSVSALVQVGEREGRLFAIEANLLEVEAGYQGSRAATENAYRILLEFLTATDVLPGWLPTRDLPVYELGDAVEKRPADRYEVFAENFDRVDAGETFAAMDGEPMVAESPFYPILMSPYGYEDIFGYTGDLLGTLD